MKSWNNHEATPYSFEKQDDASHSSATHVAILPISSNLDPENASNTSSRPHNGRLSRITSIVILAIIGSFVVVNSPYGAGCRGMMGLHGHGNEDIDAMALGLGLPKKVLKSWAQYTPWMPAGKYIPPPVSCAVSQVRSTLSNSPQAGE